MMNTVIKQLSYSNIINELRVGEFAGTMRKSNEHSPFHFLCLFKN